MNGFTAEKQKYLGMSVGEKREFYLTKKFVELKNVPTWQFDCCSRKGHFDRISKDNIDLIESVSVAFEKNDKFNEKVSIWQGDITTLEIDAVVNAANNALLGGGGVDGAIHRAAGSFLKNECRTLNGCETGDAKITGGYKLPAKYVIHTVGPREEKPGLLESCYWKSLQLLLKYNLRSIAFPCISTGIYGYPRRNAANVALQTIRRFLENNAENVDRIIFTLFLDEDVTVYETLMQLYFPVQ